MEPLTAKSAIPVILITIYRRYAELEKNLIGIRALFSEFLIEPDIVVIWAAPEVGRLWFFQNLLNRGLITHLIFREAISEEGKCATTYPESLNLRKGLLFIKQKYYNYYVIGQATDICPNPGTYKFVDENMRNDNNNAIVYFWQNGIAWADVWHTNFFVVKDDERYWPPISSLDEGDTLETQWGKKLKNQNLPGIVVTHNSRNQKFSHIHSSESLPPFPVYPQRDSSEVFLSISGYKSLYRKIKDFFKGVFIWPK